MSTVSPKVFLENQFPKRYWPLIPTTLKTAYAAAKNLASAEPVLQVESAKDNHGRLIAWATDLGFVRLIETGQLPYEYRWNKFASPTGRYLEIRLSHSVVSISQVCEPTKQPRSARFRENGKLNNEPFFDLPDFEDEHEVKGLPHFLVIHGYQSLDFAHLAVPHPHNNRDYSFVTDNLMKLPHAVPATGPAEEDTDIDFDETGLLKEEIEKWRKDNGE